MHTRDLLARGVQWLGVIVLIAALVAVLPLLAVGAWMIRAVLLVAVVTGLLSGCILYCVYPRFRHWADRWTQQTPEASR